MVNPIHGDSITQRGKETDKEASTYSNITKLTIQKILLGVFSEQYLLIIPPFL